MTLMGLSHWFKEKLESEPWPELWTTITIGGNGSGGSSDSISKLAHHLSRGGEEPLHLIVAGTTHNAEVQNMLFQHNGHRIQTITITSTKLKASRVIPDDILLLNLRAMWLPTRAASDWPAPQPNAPNLTKLVQTSGRACFSFLGGVYPLEDVVLYGGRAPFRELYQIRGSLRRLRASLLMKMNKLLVSPDDQHLAGPEGFCFPELTTLEVPGLSRHAVQFLERVALPKLHTVEVYEPPESVISRKAIPPLNQVAVLIWHDCPSELTRALKAFPRLQDISTSPSEYSYKAYGLDAELQPLFRDAQGSLPVPDLRVLRIQSGTFEGIQRMMKLRRPVLEVFSVQTLRATRAQVALLQELMHGAAFSFGSVEE